MKRPEIIAEIGVNFFDIAEKEGIGFVAACELMISRAQEAGVDTVKFQTYKADKLAAEYSPSYWDLAEEPTTSQRELFSKFDKLTVDDYQRLAELCKSAGMAFMTTPFDPDSAVQVNPLVNRHKIASADITNVELMTVVAGFGKPVLLSTGAATIEEIHTAVDILQQAGAADVTLLHCVLNYPTPVEHANLWRIPSLKAAFPHLRIGYSDHTRFNLPLLMSAWQLGAEVIEKHYTLDKSLTGNDHYHAGDANDFAALIRAIDDALVAVGSEQAGYFDPSEELARKNARRGVYLKGPARAGEPVQLSQVEFLRPQLEGLSPVTFFDYLKGEPKFASNLPANHLIGPDDISLSDS